MSTTNIRHFASSKAESARCPNAIVNFWPPSRFRQERGHSPLARYALDKCEEAFKRSEWNRFDFWFAIYRRERRHAENSDTRDVRHIFANGS